MWFPSDCMSVSAMDESNAPSSVMTPAMVLGWCTAPPIQAGLIWNVLPLELQKKLRSHDWVYPQYCRLAMGLAHAAAILMNINMTGSVVC